MLSASAVRAAAVLIAPALAAASLATGCSHSNWPDEPGVPIELVRSANIDSSDVFWNGLLKQRRAAGLTDPLLGPRYQEGIEKLAEEVQTGKLSVAQAEHAVEAWARRAYHRDVTTYAIDCAAGRAMSVPSALARAPFVAMAYAAAHFRPQSSAANRCVILAAAVSGQEAVSAINL
jgi:hypothetical protein